ncbi:hypothetical protein [Streptomyces sp. NPDC059816]|uniref:hypothetical protein n=1 Tax=Streptomyces sp. NPDC059816 TaxID=3346960 RepID=UPI0036472449
METVRLWAGAAGAFAGLSGLATLLWRPVQRIARMGRRFNQFMDDWYGEEERPGVPARPGMMERVSRIEHELCPNQDSSMRDAVDHVLRALLRMCPECSDPEREPPAGS